MKSRTRLGGAVGAAAALALVAATARCANTAGSPTTTPTPSPAKPIAGNATPAIVLNPTMPGDVTAGADASLPGLQDAFDVFAWNAFIAANWPPGPDGNGDPKQRPGAKGDNATLWERWQDAQSTFLPAGQPPVWGTPAPIPAACKAIATPGAHLLSQVGKTPDLLEESVQPFDTGPLIDQAGRYARFQIVMNRPMFDYIVANRLYSQAGQKSFTGNVAFPCGTAAGGAGAIVAKAAWKTLDAGDDPARFHTARALIYTPASDNPKIAQNCSAATVGLVGLHIAHKTTAAAQWIWTTFEHADNVPTDADVKRGALKARYNFYNPACKTCPVNTAAPRPWIPTTAGPPSQVTRVDVLPDFAKTSAAARNAAAQALLRGVSPQSVWQHYELISTQWPTNTGQCAALPADPWGTPAPTFLANTTLETYIQGATRNVSSSCVACHGNAAMTTGRASDFTYLLERAR